MLRLSSVHSGHQWEDRSSHWCEGWWFVIWYSALKINLAKTGVYLAPKVSLYVKGNGWVFFLFQYLKLVFQSGRSGYFDIELALHISVWGPHLILFLMLLTWSLQPLPTFLYCKVDGKLGNCEAAILWSTACGGWFWSDFQANGSYIKKQSYPINPLTTNDASWRCQFLATCNQLAQFVLKIGSAPAETVGQGKVHLSAFLHKRA